MNRYTISLLTMILVATGEVGAQGSRPAGGDPRAVMLAEAQAAMAPFVWLTGEWEGPATVHLANGGTMAITQKETVTQAAFGTALLIQGRGTMTTNGTERQIWDAAGLFGYSVPVKKFLFSAASGSGTMQSFDATPNGDGFVWGYTDAQGAENKFVITRTADGKWHEVGQVTTDGGKTWTVTMEFTLTKKP